ncbi:hypothetical protein V8E36_009366 [Tilletia maclaganii]
MAGSEEPVSTEPPTAESATTTTSLERTLGMLQHQLENIQHNLRYLGERLDAVEQRHHHPSSPASPHPPQPSPMTASQSQPNLTHDDEGDQSAPAAAPSLPVQEQDAFTTPAHVARRPAPPHQQLGYPTTRAIALQHSQPTPNLTTATGTSLKPVLVHRFKLMSNFERDTFRRLLKLLGTTSQDFFDAYEGNADDDQQPVARSIGNPLSNPFTPLHPPCGGNPPRTSPPRHQLVLGPDDTPHSPPTAPAFHRPLVCKPELLGEFWGKPEDLETFLGRVHDIAPFIQAFALCLYSQPNVFMFTPLKARGFCTDQWSTEGACHFLTCLHKLQL